jgi:hypothetical protein
MSKFSSILREVTRSIKAIQTATAVTATAQTDKTIYKVSCMLHHEMEYVFILTQAPLFFAAPLKSLADPVDNPGIAAYFLDQRERPRLRRLQT